MDVQEQRRLATEGDAPDSAVQRLSDDHAQPLALGERETQHLRAEGEVSQAQLVAAKRKLTANTEADRALMCACVCYVYFTHR